MNQLLKKIEYTRSERNAIIVLSLVILLLLIFKQPIVLKLFKSDKIHKEDSTRYFTALEQIEKLETNYYNHKKYTNNYSKYNYYNNYNKKSYSNNFTIDINKASAIEFEKLYGIGKVYAERIVKYRDKIGGFTNIEQLKQVYGIHDTVYKKFSHQLRISASNKTTNAIPKNLKIEINSASIEEMMQLKGIGSVYAKRIVDFRDKLGGFYTLEQIKDVYGIHDSIYKKFENNIYIKPTSIKKININTATIEELTANPYFFSTLAKQIVGYRTKVKPFASTDDLKKLYYIKDHPEYYNKILPYVVLE